MCLSLKFVSTVRDYCLLQSVFLISAVEVSGSFLKCNKVEKLHNTRRKRDGRYKKTGKSMSSNFGGHYLVVASVITDWSQWSPDGLGREETPCCNRSNANCTVQQRPNQPGFGPVYTRGWKRNIKPVSAAYKKIILLCYQILSTLEVWPLLDRLRCANKEKMKDPSYPPIKIPPFCTFMYSLIVYPHCPQMEIMLSSTLFGYVR